MACLERAVALYERAVDTVIPVSSCRAAEATKLLENIFRSVNIALVNELKVIYGAMEIDVWEVIDAAKTKPFGFMPFYPSPGLGGHCIPTDPFYLTWKAREHGQHTRFIELAGEINTHMPEHVVHRVSDALNSQRKTINGSRILILGLPPRIYFTHLCFQFSHCSVIRLSCFRKSRVGQIDSPNVAKLRRMSWTGNQHCSRPAGFYAKSEGGSLRLHLV
jgi:hypothetical protein